MLAKLCNVFLLSIFSLTLFAQENIEKRLNDLIMQDKYEQLIAQHASIASDYSAESLHYIGMAYYMIDEDENCIKFMDLSISKDPNKAKPYFYKGVSLKAMHKLEEAAICFQKAISLDPDDDEFYSQLATTYFELNAIDKALELSYIGLSKTPVGSERYNLLLYNIGLTEVEKGNYDKAEQIWLELIELVPTDYMAYSKLIQVYYHQKRYTKAEPYRAILYEANRNGLLTDTLEDMFCFDQFQWEDKKILAFERYETADKEDIYYKHLFYVTNEGGGFDIRIQTEYSPSAIKNDGYRYLLGRSIGNDEHATFPIAFKKEVDYDELKQAVIDVLDGKIQPSATSRAVNKPK